MSGTRIKTPGPQTGPKPPSQQAPKITSPQIKADRSPPPQSKVARSSSPLGALPGATAAEKGRTSETLRVTAAQAKKATTLTKPLGEVPSISQAEKNKIVENTALKAAYQQVRKMGFPNPRPMQHNGLHGVDIGAIKYKDGKPDSGIVMEVKGRTGALPSPSAFKRQVLPTYYKDRLGLAAGNNVPGAKELLGLPENKVTSYAFGLGLRDGGNVSRLHKVSNDGTFTELSTSHKPPVIPARKPSQNKPGA